MQSSAWVFSVTPLAKHGLSCSVLFTVHFVPDAFEGGTGRKVMLQNVLIQLRKCVAHPYLFNGKKILFSLSKYNFFSCMLF